MLRSVYIMTRRSDGAVKVGIAKCVATRRSKLEEKYNSKMNVEFISLPTTEVEQIERALISALLPYKLSAESKELFSCSKDIAIEELKKITDSSNHYYLLKAMKTSVLVSRHHHAMLQAISDKTQVKLASLLEEAITDIYLKYRDRL